MRLFISYFYKIRFFPKNLIPMSTAMFDPEWFHDGKGHEHSFFDRRGVYCGKRIPLLSPAFISSHGDQFLIDYDNYLHSLDFQEVYGSLNSFAECYGRRFHCSADICLMVYEKPDNPYSERPALVKWFAENGVELKEFENGKVPQQH